MIQWAAGRMEFAMITNLQTVLRCATVLATLSAVATACGDDASSDDAPDGGCPAVDAGCPAVDAGCPAGCPAPAGDLQTPPQGTPAAIDAWIAAGSYKGAGWKCEAAPHPARSPSPHGVNLICNNTKLSGTAAPADYPFGAASVKELYAADNTTIIGYATGLKLQNGASTGDKWYWYEKLSGSVVYNGKGTAANSDVCSGCHAGAGSDAAHPGRDFVYTQVP